MGGYRVAIRMGGVKSIAVRGRCASPAIKMPQHPQRYMQQPKGPLTEGPSVQESQHDHGRVLSLLKQPSRSSTSREELIWGSPNTSHIKASHPHFPHFPRFRFRIFRIFRVFVLRNLLRPLFSWGGRDVRIFRVFAVSGLNR